MKREKLINSVLKIITNNLGETTADCYRRFYEDKSDQEIRISIKALLTELVGPANAKKQLSKILH